MGETMSAVSEAPRTYSIALGLLNLLGNALKMIDDLEEAAYEEEEVAFIFVAQDLRKKIKESYDYLERVVKISFGSN